MVILDGVAMTAGAIARILSAITSGGEPGFRVRERHPHLESALRVLAPR